MQTKGRILARPTGATAVGAIIFFSIMMLVGKFSGGEWNIGPALVATAVYVALQAVLEGLRSSKG